jgi:hypothetical protein
MFILTLTGKPEQVFSLTGTDEEQVVPMFLNFEDAERYVYLIDELRDPMAPELDVVEVEDDAIIGACESHGHPYVVFDEDDLLIPPRSL